MSRTRNTESAQAFFEKAIGTSEHPEKVNKSLPEGEKIISRQVKYLNNMAEQDHREIKRITKPMLGFKSFVCAVATLSGIKLYHMVRKGQNVLQATLSCWKQFYALAA